MDEFFENWWRRVRSDGGFVLCHSTLTNALTRRWLDRKLAVRYHPSPIFSICLARQLYHLEVVRTHGARYAGPRPPWDAAATCNV